MRQSDIDWDEAARKAYHEMELQEDRDHLTIPAFAELLFDFMYEVEAECFGEEGIPEKPNPFRVRDYTDRLAQRIGKREYERWEDAEEELRLRAEDDLDRHSRKSCNGGEE